MVIAYGCATTTFRAHTALNMPEKKLVTIEETSSVGFFFLLGTIGGYGVTVKQIDEEETGIRPSIFHIGAGSHVIRIQLVDNVFSLGLGEIICQCEGVLHFDAQEGKQYVIEPNRESKPVELQIKDKETNTLVAKTICQRTSHALC